MRASRLRIFQKTLVVACVIAGVGSFLLLAQIGYYYYGTRPHEPHPEAGRVYVERVKGIGGVADVYLTRFEHLPFDYAPWIQSVSALFLVAALFLNQRWKVIHTSTYTPRKKFY